MMSIPIGNPRKLALLLLATFASSTAITGTAAERVALVIGVDKYEHLPKTAQLNVAVKDAEIMASTLRKLDPAFEVILLTDVSQDDAEDRFDDFLDRASKAECALIYFAGHGIEFHGANYLLVKDTELTVINEDVSRMKRRLGNEALSLQDMVDSLDATRAAVKVVILDCCRDNPLEAESSSGTRSVVGSRSGLAQVVPPSGTLISYSADAGQRANDGLFTEVLAKNFQRKGMPILKVFAATREEVRKISSEWADEDSRNGVPFAQRRVRHEPAEYNKLNLAGTDFVFHESGVAGPAVTPPAMKPKVPPAPLDPPNLLVNGGFEQDFSGWGTGTFEQSQKGQGLNLSAYWVGSVGTKTTKASARIDAEVSHSGNRSLKITHISEPGPNFYGTICQQVGGLRQSTEYRLSGVAKGSRATIAADPAWARRTAAGESTDWKAFELIYNTGNSTFIDFRILTESPGTIWLDDLRLEKVAQ